MPCYSPIAAHYYFESEYTGTWQLDWFNKEKNIELPCGRCIGCRLDRSKEWALRCSHEAQMHEHNCFITLTYDDYHLPEDDSLVKIHFQKFIRSLRKKTKKKIRYYMCGEYGTENNRPHYHAILFGYKFPDTHFERTRKGYQIYSSSLLERTWEHGISEIGSVTFKSAAYVARYLLKKQTDEKGKETYGKRLPEYSQMSVRPGIGKTWYEKYSATDLFPQDFAVTPDGRQMPVPKYYRKLLERADPDLHEKLRSLRIEKAINNPDNTPERLAVREIVQTEKLTRLKRQM